MGFHATIRLAGSQFSSCCCQYDNADDCAEQAKNLAKQRLEKHCLGCAEVTIFRDKKQSLFDNRIVRAFVVLKG